MHASTTFRALRHTNYRLWFIGQGISLIGVWMQNMAQQVLVYRLTGSAAALGLVNFIALIPLIPLSLIGGAFLDRFPRRKIIIITQVIMMVQALLLAGLSWSGQVRVWHVYLLSLLLGMVNAIDVPARQAFTVDMVEDKDDLTNAIGLNSAMFNGARAIGPALAGLMVAATGEGTAFFINSLTFVAVIASLAAMKNLPQPRPPDGGQRNMGRHMLAGVRYIARRRAIAFLISLIAVSAFLSMPYSTLMPVFASQVLKASARAGGALRVRDRPSPHPLPVAGRAPAGHADDRGRHRRPAWRAGGGVPLRVCPPRQAADRGQPRFPALSPAVRRFALLRALDGSPAAGGGQFCVAECAGQHACSSSLHRTSCAGGL